MDRKKYSSDDIIQIIRQAKILFGRGQTSELFAKALNVSYKSFAVVKKNTVA
jgi:hypothetical protein